VESTQYLEPTIIVMRDEEEAEGVAYVGRENALLVFRSEEEVEKFRDETGMYPASEGYEAVAVDEAEIARTCIRHNLSRICIPEAPWTGRAGVDFIDADDFVRMLRENHAG
jgi:hypothetical protein